MPDGTSASRPIVVGRLVIVVLAAAAVVWSFVPKRGGDRAASARADAYACPMHPQVTARAPGPCPICRMALERIQDARAPGPALEARAQRRSFTSEARAGAWVRPDGDIEAVFARSDLVGLTPGQQGTFFRAAAPAAALAVTLSPEPARPGGASLAKVSFRPGRGTRAGDAGEIGWIVIPATTREHLVIPSSAVLQSSRGPYVLVPASTRGDFRARAIEVGKVVQGAAIVLSGLREGEPVVVGDAFFLDAERRLADERRSSSEVGR